MKPWNIWQKLHHKTLLPSPLVNNDKLITIRPLYYVWNILIQPYHDLDSYFKSSFSIFGFYLHFHFHFLSLFHHCESSINLIFETTLKIKGLFLCLTDNFKCKMKMWQNYLLRVQHRHKSASKSVITSFLDI